MYIFSTADYLKYWSYIPETLQPPRYIRITNIKLYQTITITGIYLQKTQFKFTCSMEAEISLSISDSDALVAEYPSTS